MAGKPLPRCPKCGSNSIEETLLGVIMGPDRNRARCNCGWSGFAVETQREVTPEELQQLKELSKPRGKEDGDGL